jgi:hypothetical protein
VGRGGVVLGVLGALAGWLSAPLAMSHPTARSAHFVFGIYPGGGVGTVGPGGPTAPEDPAKAAPAGTRVATETWGQVSRLKLRSTCGECWS